MPANSGWWPRPAAGWSRSCCCSISVWRRWKALGAGWAHGRFGRIRIGRRSDGTEYGRYPGTGCPPSRSPIWPRSCWPIAISSSALAGPMIAVTVDVEGGALPVRLSGEDLTRILVNLVKNAAEAMPEGGRIQLGLHERPDEERRCRGSDAHGGGQRAGHPSQGARGDLRVRLHHPLRRSRRARRLAGLASRPGPVDYPLHRRGCRRPRSCRQPRSRRSPL